MLLTTARYERAIVLPDNDYEAGSLMRVCLVLNVVVTSIAFVVVAVLYRPLLNLFGIEALGPYLLLVPLGMMLYGMFFTFSYMLNRQKAFRPMAAGNILNSGGTAAAQLLLHALKEGGLILAVIAARTVAMAYYARSAFRGMVTTTKLSSVSSAMKSIARKYGDFPRYALPQAFINTLSASLPLLLLGSFFTAEVTGQYGWAFRMIQAPITLIAAATYQVFFQEASQRYNQGEGLSKLVVSLYKRLFLIGFGPYLILFLFAPAIFSFVFGQEWADAGRYAMYLSPWYFMIFLNTPIMALVYVLNKQKILLFMEIILLVARFGALYLGYLLHDPDAAIIAYGAVGLVYHLILWRMFLGMSKMTKVGA